MELTRELLEERKQTMQADFERTRADLNAISGAIQTIDWCLEKLDDEEAEEE